MLQKKKNLVLLARVFGVLSERQSRVTGLVIVSSDDPNRI